jgi:hypothetical protein
MSTEEKDEINFGELAKLCGSPGRAGGKSLPEPPSFSIVDRQCGNNFLKQVDTLVNDGDVHI